MTEKNRGTTINLLPQELRETGRVRALRRLLRRGSFTVLAVYLFVISLLFLAYFFFLRREAAVNALYTQAKAGVEALKENEANLVILRDRTNIAKGVFARAAAAPEKLIDEAFLLLPASVQISEIKAEEGKINIDATAPTSGDLTALFSSLERSEFKDMLLKNLTLGASGGGYSFSLELR
ncbi:MAG: PilN domain-containing protein [Candidatus Blackburnbacteria bacterium]|nr:PilN domain-containing protein [Candidatus Blackburnbacteria bacterium]